MERVLILLKAVNRDPPRRELSGQMKQQHWVLIRQPLFRMAALGRASSECVSVVGRGGGKMRMMRQEVPGARERGGETSQDDSPHIKPRPSEPLQSSRSGSEAPK